MTTATANPDALQLKLRLNRPQSEFWIADGFIAAMITGIGGGKTWVATRKMLETTYAYPGSVGLLAANTFQQLNETLIQKLQELHDQMGWRDEREYVIGKRPPSDWGIPRRFRDYDSVLSYRETKTTVVLRTLHDPGPLRGAEYDWAFLDETRDTPWESFTVVLARMRGTVGPRRIWITTTPNGFDWLYDLLVDKAADPAWCAQLSEQYGIAPEQLFKLVRGSSYDNRENLPPLYFAVQEAALTEELAQQELYGEFLNVGAGQVYYAFNRFEHVDDMRARHNAKLPTILACDFNSVAPLCWVVGQHHEGYDVVTDEVRIANGTTPQALERFHSLYPPAQCQGGVIVHGDATQKTRSATTGKSDYEIIRDFLVSRGYHLRRLDIPSANPPVVDRVNIVNTRLRNVHGDRRLFISARCQHLKTDFERVRYKPGTRNIDQTGDENKVLSHLSDACGYWLHRAYKGGRAPRFDDQPMLPVPDVVSASVECERCAGLGLLESGTRCPACGGDGARKGDDAARRQSLIDAIGGRRRERSDRNREDG